MLAEVGDLMFGSADLVKTFDPLHVLQANCDSMIQLADSMKAAFRRTPRRARCLRMLQQPFVLRSGEDTIVRSYGGKLVGLQ